ncbi:unnamed protein product [Durusdinium trenchii]|uniref:SLC41A/MgtE integral membrane domain-containing protein n=1 Tax=Durusdinium trenchii TaxID=1381693 RepID=A0ABP0PK53_9DINO
MGSEEELGLLAEFGDEGVPCFDEEARHRNRPKLKAEGPGTRPLILHDAGDEDRASAGLHIFWHRAGWLVLLLLCQSSSSFILQRFEFLIKSHPTVIYFLTMLVGAGGNAGGQSTVLVVRRLALAACHRSEGTTVISFRRIIAPEILVGAKLAVVLFGAAFLRCIIFKVYGAECVAICLSMLVIVFTSTALGAALPLFLSQMGVDPAHAGATIQVLMDVSGVALTCVISSTVLGFQEVTLPDKSTSLSTSMHGSLEVVVRHSSSLGTVEATSAPPG